MKYLYLFPCLGWLEKARNIIGEGGGGFETRAEVQDMQITILCFLSGMGVGWGGSLAFPAAIKTWLLRQIF